ncbi:protein-L-isoaspartate(D-aspartate) O-methyltransferase [Campylobacter sp. FMV-PI01]|uniref:Protein-L-isoaspartate O-methyltransferase n=1 Tax=Campylobacter portucalensis TaxID=2608384 RepID=A0A6L5WGE3_9BACT|nr:protein-L-isoaspartate(D-aspartate) O-methyltransferase [Campylobacter portucalensis]MSN96240.1 protein-L-isoaspartate(D-aspartate) O-methyltransferase [Campylobacter portucalensis]
MDTLTALKCKNLADNIANEINLSPALYDAFSQIDRSKFCNIKAHAFSLDPQRILANQWISSPLTVAKMTMALELDGVDSVLEIGCGSGYQAAILSQIVRRVFSIERIEKLANQAKECIKNLKISNIHIKFDDGNGGWKKYAPYERILLSAATEKIDERLFIQLENNGILVAPIKRGNKQNITKFIKNEIGQIEEIILDECEFVPLLKGTTI